MKHFNLVSKRAMRIWERWWEIKSSNCFRIQGHIPMKHRISRRIGRTHSGERIMPGWPKSRKQLILTDCFSAIIALAVRILKRSRLGEHRIIYFSNNKIGTSYEYFNFCRQESKVDFGRV